MLPQGAAVTVRDLLHFYQGRLVNQQENFGMPHFYEVSCHLIGAFLIIYVAEITAQPGVAGTDVYPGKLRAQKGGKLVALQQGRNQNKTVYLTAYHHLKVLGLLLRVGVGVAQQYGVLLLQGNSLYAGHDLPVAPELDIRHQQRDGAGFAKVQTAGKPVGTVIQAFHHRQHMGLCFRLDLFGMIQHAGNGRDRNTGGLSDFFNVDRSSLPLA